MVSKSGLMNFLGAMIIALLPHGQVFSQDLSRAGSKMKVQPLIDGCTVPGGLQPITSSDGPNDAMFWCGTPPYCLTMPVGNVERCHIIPGSRNGGTNGVRNPQDLMCDVANVNPTGPAHATPGRCPVVPTLGVTVNNAATVAVVRGATLTLRVNTANATPMSAPTTYTMACTGAQAALTPFNQTNLIAYAGLDHTFSPTTTTAAGSTSCTVTATNAAGTTTRTVSFNVTVQNPPSVSASFNPTSPTPGGPVRLTTSTSNANSLRWSCTGRWTNSNTNRSTGGNIRTNHTATGSAGTAKCTFTATGPGGTATANANWTSVAGGSGGSGGSSVVVPPIASNCAVESRSFGVAAQGTSGQCHAALPRGVAGQQVRAVYSFGWMDGSAIYRCVNGSWSLVRVESCSSSGTGG